MPQRDDKEDILADQQALRVLLIEDNPDDVAIVERLVSKATIPVRLTVVRSGQEALGYLLGSADRPGGFVPGMILLDISLPDLDGIRVLRRLKAERSLADIPVIMLTGSNSDRHVREAHDLGAHSHIVKPMSVRDFRWIITSVHNYWNAIGKLEVHPVRQAAGG